MTKNHSYINEAHKAYSEACQKEVEEMSKKPHSADQMIEQALRNKKASMRRYMNDAHREYSEASIKEVEEMSEHPLSWEEMKAQCDRIEAMSGQKQK